MANYSCINHPEKDYLLILRNWQIEFCEGDKVAAGLLSIFEYWYNIKYRKQLQKTEEARETKDLLQFHSETDLIDKMLSITHTPANIRKGINFLKEKRVITIYRNPSKRYSYDRTRHFLLHPEVLNQWLTEQYKKTVSKPILLNYAKKETIHKEGETLQNPEAPSLEHIKDTVPPVVDSPNAEESEKQEVKSALVLFSLLQDLPLKDHIGISNILENLHNPALYQPIFDEWHHALAQGHIKNKFAYLASLVKHANQGTFNPTQSQQQQINQKITGVISVDREKPISKQAHDIFPIYEAWQGVQQIFSKDIKKSEYMNFVLPARAYESDKAVFIRCPNVYAHNFMKSNIDKIAAIVGKTVKVYLG